MLQKSKIQPKLSAYALIHGQFDFNATPLAPAGCRIIIHDRKGERKTWAKRGTPGFYIGPAMQHYRNYKCHITKTHKNRISNTLQFFPTCCDLPETTPLDRLNLILNEIREIVQHPKTGPTLLQGTPGTETDACIQKIGKLLSTGVIGPRVGKTSPKTTPITPPRVEDTGAAAPRVERRKTRSNAIYGTGTIVRKPTSNGHKEGEVTAYDSINSLYKIKYQNGTTDEFDTTEIKQYYKPFQAYSNAKKYNKALFTNRYDTSFNYALFPTAKHTAATPINQFAMAASGKVWDEELNKMAHYRDLAKHPNKAIRDMWIEGAENEFARLFQGYKDIEGLNVLEWIPWEAVPKGQTVTYACWTLAFRPEKAEQNSV